MTKKSKGRQKIEMAKMKNETNLQVTFSKRRSGIFKKASELCTLCGAEVALIVYSPSGKVFSFGHPNVDTVIDRFLNNNPPLPHQPNNAQLNESYRNSVIQDMNNDLTKVLDDLESEKKTNEKLRKLWENSKTAENWWEDAVEGFSLSQCNEFKDKLKSLKKKVTLEASKLFQAKMSHQNFYIGSSSNVAYGADSGSNINHGFDLFSQRRQVNINAFINNQNMVPSNHALQLRNHGNNTIIEGLVPGYNMNYTPWFNQNQMQNQNQNQIPSIKRESIYEYDEHYHHGHHPHPRRDYF